MTQPRRWLARILIVASIVVLAACTTHHVVRESDVSRDESTSIFPSRLTSLPQVIKVELEAKAFAPDKVKLAIHLPPGYDPAAAVDYPVLYLNDGQDAAAVELAPTLAKLYADDAIEKVIVVAIDMLPDRMGTYGLSDRAGRRSITGDSRFGPIGSRAYDYSE
jgi:hypothetical protein